MTSKIMHSAPVKLVIKSTNKMAKQEIRLTSKEIRSFSVMIFIIALVPGFMVGDFLSIYPVVKELSFTEPFISMILVGMAVFIIDYTPVMIGNHLQKYLDVKKEDRSEAVGHLVWVILLSIMLTLLLVILGILRWQGRTQLYYEEAMGSSIRGVASIDEFECTSGQNYMTLFMCIIPAFSTVFIFALTYPASLAKVRELMDKKRLVKLKRERVTALAVIRALEEERNVINEVQFGKELHEAEMRLLGHMKDYAKMLSDVPMMVDGKDPDVVSLVISRRAKQQETQLSTQS